MTVGQRIMGHGTNGHADIRSSFSLSLMTDNGGFRSGLCSVDLGLGSLISSAIS